MICTKPCVGQAFIREAVNEGSGDRDCRRHSDDNLEHKKKEDALEKAKHQVDTKHHPHTLAASLLNRTRVVVRVQGTQCVFASDTRPTGV